MLSEIQTVDEMISERLLLKSGEKIPNSIRIIRTDNKFDGDCRVETNGIPLTAWEVVWNFFHFAGRPWTYMLKTK